MAASKELIEKINTLIAEEFEVEIERIVPDGALMETLNLDSLDLVDMVVLVEQAFGITLRPEDFAGVRTFDDFYNLIDRKTTNNG